MVGHGDIQAGKLSSWVMNARLTPQSAVANEDCLARDATGRHVHIRNWNPGKLLADEMIPIYR